MDALLRTTVLSQAGGYGDSQVLSQAMDLFHNVPGRPGEGSPRPAGRGVLAGGAMPGTRPPTGSFGELENRAALQEEKMRLLLGLSRFSQPELPDRDAGSGL